MFDIAHVIIGNFEYEKWTRSVHLVVGISWVAVFTRSSEALSFLLALNELLVKRLFS